MATRQQRIQQERQRQQEEAAARRQLPDRPLGAEAIDAIEQDIAAFTQLPGVRQTLGFAGGAVKMVNEFVLEPARYAATDPSQAGTPMALAGTALTFGEGLMEKSAEGGAILAEKMGVDPRIGGFVGGTAAETLLTAGLGAAGRKITQAVDMIPPGGTMPQLATAGVTPGVMGAVADVGQDLTTQMAQPLQIASDLKRGSAWQNTVRTLQQGDNTRQIRDFLLRGPGGKIKGKNLLVTADELAANKEGIMDKLLKRADAVAKAWDRYQRGGSAKAQRNLYDIASKNIFDSAEMIYGKEGPRSYLAKVSNWLTNDEWHHVFGNKEAGEFILMQAAQDPLVAANIFKRMENLGLNSSGVAQNIALMKSKRHTNWHDFMKAEGFEPKSPGKPLTTAGSTAPGDFADLSKALGEEIAAGRGDVNDIFKMLDLYADYNRWVKSKLPEYGAEIISDLPEGVGKSMQIGGYKTKPGRPRSKMK
jgi:hypothetical protein